MSSFKTLNRFATSSVKWDLIGQKTGKDNFLSFSIADSDYLTAEPIIDALKKRVDHGAFGYTFVDDEYYEIVQAWVKRQYDYQVEREWIITSPGVVTSLFHLVDLLTEKNDKIVIQPPVYNPFYQVVENNGRSLVLNRLINRNGRYYIDFEDLEKQFISGVKMMILCNPHNPIGRVWSKDELARLVNLCKQYRVFLISDEIHCDIILSDDKFTSIGHFINQYDQVVICTAPSKTFNIAGLHISNLFIPCPKIKELISKDFCNESLTCPNLLAITACKAAYTKCDNWLVEQLAHLRNNFLYLKTFFRKYIPQAKVTEAEGTYLAWIDLSFLKMSGSAIVTELQEYGIFLNNGCIYSRVPDSFIRINFACSTEQLAAGLKIIQLFVNDKITKKNM